MINVIRLEEKLRDNYEDIVKILVKLGFDEDSMRYRESQHLITSRRPEEGADNPNGCLIYTNSLNVIFTTRNWNGNLFSLTMKIREVGFPKALELIQNWIGYDAGEIETEIPFGGFYKRHSGKAVSSEKLDLPVHSEDELPPAGSLSDNYAKDGVAATVQEKWGVRYDHDENAILIPIYDYSGQLVGCKARSNNPDCAPEDRFWAYIPYAKTQVVYGWFQNFQRISEKQAVIVVESEKGVLQAASFGCEIAVGIGGHNMSGVQARYIKLLGTKRIIIAFDEGISEEEIKSECRKVNYRKNVYYIYDEDHLVLPKGSKDSPVDHGSKGLQTLMKKCMRKFNE